MLEQIVEALKKRSDLTGWTVRHHQRSGAQAYAVPQGLESLRAVDSERFLIDLLRKTTTADGSPAIGSGDASLLPGQDIGKAIDQAALVAELVVNPVHGLPAPAPIPDVPLCDADLQSDPSGVMLGVMESIQATVLKQSRIRLTAAECFGEILNTHLVNSRGIDAQQTSTQINIEFVLHGKNGDREVETFDEVTRRRASDLHIDSAIEDRIRYTLDSLDAGTSVTWQGPVVLRNEALATFLSGDGLTGDVLRTRGSAEAKYAGFSPWEPGKSVFRGEVLGDPLTVWANRSLPFGSGSDCFDAEGLPAQRVPLIRNNQFVSFAASQRYADYLQIPATGAFGNVELSAGKVPAADLLTEPYLEVVQFSWFNPNPVSGEFSTEIRFGYLVENGVRKPFKGGQLIGNYMDALANVYWSAETAFFGAYLGPHTARFNELKVA